MDLLLIRHAIAADREVFAKTGMSDDLRPLTVEGRKKMRRAVESLRRIAEDVDLILTSPLARAVETAHIVARPYPDATVKELIDLAPRGSVEGVLKFVTKQQKKCVALVGHDPDLGKLLCHAIGCKHADRIPLKKGGVALLSFDGPVTPGHGVLKLLLTPQLLRRLAKA